MCLTLNSFATSARNTLIQSLPQIKSFNFKTNSFKKITLSIPALQLAIYFHEK